MPKSASCLPNPKDAISAKVSRTWSPTAPPKPSSHLRGLRESLAVSKKRKQSTVILHHPPGAPTETAETAGTTLENQSYHYTGKTNTNAAVGTPSGL